MKLFLLLSLFFTFAFHSYGSYDYDVNCQQAFLEILDLKTSTARETLNKEKSLHPGNSYVIYLEHYADAVELIIMEDPSRYEKFYNDYYARRAMMDKEDASSPYHKLLQAEMMFHMGLAQLKYGNKIYGARKIYSSYFLIKDNLKEHPDFWLSQKMQGVYNVLFANIPISIRWAARIVGISGNINTGLSEMQAYFEKARTLPGYAEEGVLFLNFGYKYEWDDLGGFEFLTGLDPKLREPALIKYFYANLATASGKNDLALDLLKSIRKEHSQVPFYGLDFLEGYCRLNCLDDSASIFLQRYLNNFPGLDYKKDICMHLSWYYLLQGDILKYEEYRAKVSEIGTDLRDRDRDAIIENKLDYNPHPELLKARLLCDGGYYDRAKKIMAGSTVPQQSQKAYYLEYFYRYGRIYQKEGDTIKALEYLHRTVADGQHDPCTFACVAAYQLGVIYETRKDYPQALTYYEKSLDLFNSGYTVETLEAKAEKGVDRVKRIQDN